MKQNDAFDSIQQFGHESLNKYETAGGLLDIGCGIYLLASSSFLFVHKIGYWMYLWWIILLGLFLIALYLRKKIILPRIGMAKFSKQIQEPKRNLISRIELIIVFFVYSLWLIADPHFLPTANIVMCFNFGIIGSKSLAKVKYYFIAAFASVPFIYPYFKPDYQNTLVAAFLLFVMALISKWIWTKSSWEPCKKEVKPKNFLQMIFMLIIALAIECFLFTIFRPDVAEFMRNWTSHHTILTVGLVISILMILLGILQRTPRMYGYAVLVIGMSSLSNLMNAIHINPGLLILSSGIIILLSGIRILRQFIKNNPILEDDNFLEDKVLYDTK